MKPITYWVQNDAIDRLVEQFGPQLEKLSPGVRRELIACLALATATKVYDWGHAEPAAGSMHTLIASLTRHEQDLLMEAIAATLTHQGNPWVENARTNVAIEQAHGAQKNGHPRC